jgi:hypothetical protein
MERLSQLELEKMVAAGLVSSVIATKKEGFYRVVIETPKKAFILKSQRDDVRLFKTLSGVETMLESVDIKTFTVLG